MSFTSALESLRSSYDYSKSEGEPIGKDSFTKAVEEALTSPKGFVIVGVTSNTQASYESEQTPYGAGKTTLAMDLSYKFNHFDPETRRYWDAAEDRENLASWESTNDNMWYYPSRIIRSMDDAVSKHRRLLAGVWEDVQYTAPATTGVSQAVLDLVGDLTTDRPEIGVLFLTMPNVMGISAPLRNLIQFELIVHAKGYFEAQHVSYRKNFKNPKKDFMNLDYVSGLPKDGVRPPDFYPLPKAEQEWYDEWRAEQKSYKRQRTISSLERFERTFQPATKQKTIIEEPQKMKPKDEGLRMPDGKVAWG